MTLNHTCETTTYSDVVFVARQATFSWTFLDGWLRCRPVFALVRWCAGESDNRPGACFLGRLWDQHLRKGRPTSNQCTASGVARANPTKDREPAFWVDYGTNT